MRLDLCGSVVGRLVDQDGQPIANGEISGGLQPDQFGISAGEGATLHQFTDQTGRFHAEGMIPGAKYNIGTVEKTMFRQIFKDLRMKPGEKKDLGDVKPGSSL